ncbi:MAG: acyclic terpene utilization AtuA family protein [Acidobacteriota bacterium]
MVKTVRIGCGAGYSGDRIDPAVELAAKGSIGYLVFECLAERTIALAQKARLLDPSTGYDPLLEERMAAVLPLCAEKKIRIVSNMGAANPSAAAIRTREVARHLGIRGLRIAAVTGDDVLSLIRDDPSPLLGELAEVSMEKIVSANAYLGVEPILEALAADADVVLTGRIADPSMFLAILIHEFGWPLDHWNWLGQGTVIGHLLECAGQITGGYFADPGYLDVPDLARLGFPIAEVSEDGSAVISKVEGSGGLITRANCTEQLLYEIQDPAAYLTPDVTADFSQVSMEEIGRDRIRVLGGRGRPRPDTLKVSVGFHDGYVGEGQISYAGPGALERAQLAKEILLQRLSGFSFSELRFDFIGLNAILAAKLPSGRCEPQEVRLRAAGRSSSWKDAAMIPREVEALYTNGPASGGGVTGSARETLGILSTLIPRSILAPHVQYEVS